jgi:hypothetical protein
MKIRGTSSARPCHTRWRDGMLSRLPIRPAVVSLVVLISVGAEAQAAALIPPNLMAAVIFGPDPVEATPVKQEMLRMPAHLIIRDESIEAVNEPNRHTADAPLPVKSDTVAAGGASAVQVDLLKLGLTKTITNTAPSLLPPVSVIGVLFHKDDRFADGFDPHHRVDWLYVRAGRRLLALSLQQDEHRKPHLKVQIPVGAWLFQGRQAEPETLQRSGMSCGHLRPLVRPLVGEHLGHSLSCRLILPW